MPDRPIDRRALLGGLAVAGALALPSGRAPAAAPPLIAAASDLQFALKEAAAAFAGETGEGVRLAFGSSGNFARQIRQGAPFELFLSADEDYALALVRDGFARDEGALYGVGRLALFVPHGSPLKADGSLADLAAALAGGRVSRFAIANPEHAPYGQRAEEALRRVGVWDEILPRLVLGENVSQAAQFAASGAAEGGLIAYSLALSPQLAGKGAHALVPESLHSPLNQRMVLLRDAGPTAERFYAWMRSPVARAILRGGGFALPGEAD